jgi:mannosyltransferase OCH1-like enzyme
VIPKVIVQTSKNPPNVYRVAKIKEFCPGYEYEHYTDDDIKKFFSTDPDLLFPNIINVFEKIKIGQHKADFFRYYYLYKKGGVYMDTDLMLNTNIEEIVQDYKFVSVTTTPNIAFNGFICVTPKHNIMYLALRHIYTTYTNTSDVPYHLFCHELMKIINVFRDSTVDTQLTEFTDEDAGISTIKNSQGQEMLFHYFKYKEFPVTFITKSDDFT